MKKFILLIIACSCFFSVHAAYLKDVPMTLTQPDGTVLHCYASGDEYFNYLHDSNGFTIMQHPQTGFYVYADKRDGQLVATDFVAGTVNPASKGLRPHNLISPQEWTARRNAWHEREMPIVFNRDGQPNHGTLNNISIFIRFADDEEFTNTYSSIDNMFNDITENAISLRNYFRAASYNSIEIPTYFYPGHNGETIISYQDTYPRSYFEPYNAATNPNGYQESERAGREFSLLERAVNYINANYPIPTDLNIDYDNDGYIDNVCFIVRGSVGAWNDLLWPHKWSLYDRNVYINGKRVYTFNFQLADATSYFNTSTMCHEMNHSLSAPDLYHYSYSGPTPVGIWDLMQNNTTPPQHCGAYMKMKYGHWVDEIPEITEAGIYTLNPISSPTPTNIAYKIATDDPNQFYVVEYRDNTSLFETGLPGSGLLVYRIDTRFDGNASYDPSNGIYDEVYIFRPGGSYSEEGYLYSAYFSAESGRTEFSSSTSAYPFFTDGTPDNNFRIYDITSAGSTISFSYGTSADCEPPTNLVASAVNTDVTLTWDAATGAVSYNVYRDGSMIGNTTETTYTDYNLFYGQHTYFLKSVDANGLYSTSSESVSVTIEPEGGVFIGDGGTATNAYLPSYSFYCYSYSQQIYTASEIGSWGSILSVSFYNDGTERTRNYDIYLVHTDKTAFQSTNDWIPVTESDLVFRGDVTMSSGTWTTITFDSLFVYDGVSNLALVVDDNTGSWLSPYMACRVFETNEVQAMHIYSDDTNYNPYSPYGYYGTQYTQKNQILLTLDTTFSEPVVIPDTLNISYRPNEAWMRPYSFQIYNPGNYTRINSVSTDNTYFQLEEVDVPFVLKYGQSRELGLTHGEGEGEMTGHLIINYGDNEEVQFDLSAIAYDPAVKDVWETAYEVTSFPYTDSIVVADIPLYNNYNLPPTDIADGADAVYKLVFTEDALLNASMTSGENGKLVLYRDGFEGEGGPMEENYYSEVMNNSHSSSIPMEVQIGDGTNTTYYFPIDNFFNYSCTQQIYTAEEIGTAGTITSISFYYNYGTAYTCNNVTMYMKNVSRSSFASTSDYEPLALGDIVWTGAIAPTSAGWYTFTLDTPFEYNGTDNLLVAFFDGTSGYPGTSYTWRQTTSPNSAYMALRYYSDSYCPDPYNLGSYSGSKMWYTYRANVQIGITPPCPNTITDMTVARGTYYLVTSSTSDAWGIEINTDVLSCPEMVSHPTPADYDTDVIPTAVQLQWSLGERTTEYLLLLGTEYDNLDTIVDWTRDLTESYVVTGLLNNANYFWQIKERNDGCPEGVDGPVWGFTTLLNGPQNLYASNYNIFEGDDAYLEWIPIADTNILSYNIYQDNVLIGNTTTNNYTVSDLTYNMTDGYSFYVTGVYAGGESNPSDEVTVWVSGNGFVAGHVYEQDGTTGIENATVTFMGNDEFGYSNTFTFTTDASGFYTGSLKAGTYSATASCGGYQNNRYDGTASITYGETTESIDINLDEIYYPVSEVVAEYYPDATDPNSPYVKVYWDNNVANWLYYDDGLNQDAIGLNGGGSFYWGIMFPSGNYSGNKVTKISMYDYAAHTGNIMIFQDGSSAPSSLLYTQEYSCTGSGDFVEWTLNTPVFIDPSLSLWIVMNNNDGQYIASCCANTGDPNGRWISLDGTEWDDLASYGLDYTWMLRAYVTGGQGSSTMLAYPSPNNQSISLGNVSMGDNRSASFVTDPDATPHYVGTPADANRNSRSFNHYRVYRTNAYNNGPYTEENTMLLTDNVTDTLLIDATWPDAEAGVYKYGVSRVYEGNRGEGHRNIVEIASGDTYAVAYPVNFIWAYTENQMILSADEIGTEGMITSVAYKRYSEGSGNPETRNIDIYMKHTNMDAYSSTSDWIPVAAADLVFSGNYTFQTTNNDWQTITLQTPFEFNGVDNLLICIVDNSGVTSTRQYWSCHNTSVNRGMRAWGSSNFDPTAAGTPSAGSSSTNAYVADIRLNIEPIANPIQVERESAIVWSNPIDKSMYLTDGAVNVTVTLNSGDSPEGVLVQFINLNPTEQALYPVADLTLDATGYYAFESFRRGDYQVQVSFNDYYSITEEVSIWDATALTYMLNEINYAISNLYVSRTGWATWNDEMHGNTVPSLDFTFEPSSFFVDFEGGLPEGWTINDANNDGWTWCLTSAIPSTWTNYSGLSLDWYYSGSDAICSGSYINGPGVLNPDEYLISPAVNIGDASQLSFWVAAADVNYPADHFGVFVSTTGTEPSDFTCVQEWTLTAKGEGKAGDGRAARDGRNLRLGNWYNYTVDLSAYAGNACYIAFRHYNCSDQYIMCLDDITLTNGAKGQKGMKHFQQYQMVCTDAEDNVIFDITTSNCYNQLPTEDLIDGETYHLKVAEVYSSGLSEWQEIDWAYQSCDNFEVVTELNMDMNDTANVISWVYPTIEERSIMTGSYPAYACRLWNGDNSNNPIGWYSFDLETPNINSLINSNLYIVGGDYCPLDGYVHSTTDYGDWIVIAPETGEIIDQGSLGFTFRDCAWDNTTNMMYGAYSGGLYSWDVETNITTYIGNIGFTVQVLVCDLNGQLYAINDGDANLYRINKDTGASTYVGNTGLNSYYWQSGAFDHYSGKLYWAGINSNANGYFAEIDTETGEATVLVNNTGQVLSFCVPFDGADYVSPVTGILGAMVYRDGELLGFTTSNTFTDTIVTGNHEYAIRVVYDGMHRCPNYNAYYAMSCPLSIGGTSYEVTVTANPTQGGETTGSGSYINGFPCTVTATANDGYVFTNWVMDGEEITNTPEHTFRVRDNIDMVANFIGFTPHWEVVDNPEYTPQSLIGVVNVDGEEITGNYMEVAALCGDECRGRQMLTYYPELNRFLVFMTIYGQEGDDITFGLYNHELGEETEYSCLSHLNFNVGTDIGSYDDPYPIMFGIIQISAVQTGWNWYSTYVEQEGIEGLEMLETSLGTDGVMIKSQSDGFTINYGGLWMGNLNNISNEQMYMIKSNAPIDAVVSGFTINANNHPITLYSGWTWIGYPNMEAMDINDALANLNATNGDVLKSKQTFSTYIEGQGWFGTLNTLEPAMGMMYHSMRNNNTTFIYADTLSRNELVPNLTAQNNHWVPNDYEYPDNMSVMAVVELDNMEVAGNNYELAVFEGSKCLGSTKLIYVGPANRYMAFLTLSGEEDHILSFGLYDAESGTEYAPATEMLVCTPNDIVGSMDEPFIVHFDKSTGVNQYDTNMTIHPNPANRGSLCSIALSTNKAENVTVEIVNALGEIVSVTSSSQFPTMVKAPNVAGVYMVRVVIDGKESYSRKLIVK